MKGFHVLASGAIQGHDGPLVSIMLPSLKDPSREKCNFLATFDLSFENIFLSGKRSKGLLMGHSQEL